VCVERAAFGFNGSGVLVKSGDKVIARLSCDEQRPLPDTLYELDDLALPAAQFEDVEPAR
jgi:hypothetical protein